MQTLGSTQVSNLNIKQGDLMIKQGEQATTLILLHQGQVTFQLNINSENSANTVKNIYSMNSPSIIGGSSLVLGRAYPYSISAASALVISSAPSNEESLLKFFASKPNMVPLLLRSILKETIEAYNKVNIICTTAINLARYITSISLAYCKIYPDLLKQIKINKNDKALIFALKKYKAFKNKRLEVPDQITIDFLKEDHLEPDQHQAHLHFHFDTEEFNYYRRFTQLPTQILEAIAIQDPKLILITAQKLGNISFTLIEGLIESNQYLEAKIDLLFNSEYGWIKKISSLLSKQHDPRQIINLKNIAKFFIKVTGMAEKQYQTIWKKISLFDKIDKQALKKIDIFLNSYESQNISKSTQTDTIKIDPKALEATKGMAKNIFEYAEIPEKFSEYSTLIQKIKILKNPLDTDDETRKLRRGLNNLFWEVYEMAILKHVKSKDQLPRYMKIFFNYSIIEADLLEPNQLGFLYHAKENNDSGKYQLYTPIEWIQKIYDRDVPTSINELGLTFFDIIRQNNREKSWKKESDLPSEIDTSEARLKFEIQNMLISNTKLTSGSVVTYLAPLSKFKINRVIDQAFVNKQKLEEALDKLLEVDFSCFHREVLYERKELGILREFIQVQVIPNIILTPTSGDIFQYWQEREGKNRMSPGRLCCPSIATDDLYKLILSASACYRWEITKTLLGFDWNNIAQSSITADYTDYIQFFKKNRELSPEIKEKISQEFKRFRDDRSRFVHDYTTWVMFESEGTQRLNKVSRKIMAKHIPFRKPYREKLLRLPNYIDLINKNINIRQRKARELEPRLKKYRRQNNDKIPEELSETFNFYNMKY